MSGGDCISSGSDFLKINVTNSQNANVAFDIKFAKSMTVAELKNRLQIITGGNAGSMQVELHKGEQLIAVLNDDTIILGSLPIDPGMHFHVKDDFISNIDLQEVEKFQLSEDQYEQMDNTLRNFLRKNRLGKYNEEEFKVEEEKRLEKFRLEKAKAKLCTLGSRCEVTAKGQPKRRGTIMYNGELEGKSGVFIGVKYDEPLGKNDGSVDGKRYFSCPDNYGGFVSPMLVTVGDFPEETYDLDDEI